MVAIVISLDEDSHSLQQRILFRRPFPLTFVHERFHCSYHSVVFFLVLDGLHGDAVREAGVFLGSTVKVALMLSTLPSCLPRES